MFDRLAKINLNEEIDDRMFNRLLQSYKKFDGILFVCKSFDDDSSKRIEIAYNFGFKFIVLDITQISSLLNSIFNRIADYLSYIIVSDNLFYNSYIDAKSLHNLCLKYKIYIMLRIAIDANNYNNITELCDLLDPIYIDLVCSVTKSDLFITEKRIKQLLQYVNQKEKYLCIRGLPPCFISTQQDVFVNNFRKKINYQYSSLDNVFVEPVFDLNHKRGKGCNLCKYTNVCQGISSNMVDNGILEKSIVKQVYDKHTFFNDLKEMKENHDTRIDAIVLFSGGLDSKVAASLYAQENRGKNIALLTFDHSGMINVSKSTYSSKLIKNKWENIINHDIVKIPDSMFTDIAFGKESLLFCSESDCNVGCALCKIIMLNVAIYIAKNVYGCNKIITGNNRVSGRRASYEPFPQSEKMINLYNEIAISNSIDLIHPIYNCHNRNEVIEIANKLEIEQSSLYSPKCVMGIPKAMKYGDEIIMDWLNWKTKSIDKLFESVV